MEEYQREGLADPIEDNSSRKQKDMPNWGRRRRKNKALEKEKEIVICPVCLEGVREKSILDHQARHNRKYFICRRCSVKYKSKSDLWSHQEKNHK